MIDILLVILFCYQLNRMARERGISSMPYVLNYLAAFFIMMSVMLYVFFSIYDGVAAMQDPEALKGMMMLEPFAILFEVFVFIYFRKRIQKVAIVSDNDNDATPPPPSPSSPFSKKKKDLSYFR